jgi:hypothetical protein
MKVSRVQALITVDKMGGKVLFDGLLYVTCENSGVVAFVDLEKSATRRTARSSRHCGPSPGRSPATARMVKPRWSPACAAPQLP